MKSWLKTVVILAGISFAACHLAPAQPQERGKAADARQAGKGASKQAAEAEARRPDSIPPAAGDQKAASRRDGGRGGPTATEEGSRADGSSEAGRARRAAAKERQAARFGEIHARRMAKLQRLRDLAVENDRRDVIARVDGLISRELEHHARKTNRLQAQADPAEARDAETEKE